LGASLQVKLVACARRFGSGRKYCLLLSIEEKPLKLILFVFENVDGKSTGRL
jgi:hypothetical protein